jgi:general secretion pathway protein B
MSYILDALKKSEKERQRGQLPDMLTLQNIVAEKPAKRVCWPYLLAAALILNAGILIWLTGFSSRADKFSAKPAGEEFSILDNVAVQTIPEPGRPAVPSSKSISPEANLRFADKKTATDPEIISAEPKKTENVPETSMSLKGDESSSAGDTHKKDKKNPTQPLPKDTVPASAEPKDELAALDRNKIYRFRELPLSLRETLPSFSISALMYSDTPSSRMVRVNHEMVHEGQEMAPGLKLEEIANDGVIFRYRDTVSFWVGVK